MLPWAATAQTNSRVDLYGGFGYYHPFGRDNLNLPYETAGAGVVASAAYFFGRSFGVQTEFNLFPPGAQDHDCVYGAQVGPIIRRSSGRVVPFVHALGGAQKIGGPNAYPCSGWGWGMTAGGGVDVVTPLLHDRLAVRPLQVDIQYNHINDATANGGTALSVVGGDTPAVRISAGITLRLGEARQPERTMTCLAEPSDAFAGDPITLSANVLNLKDLKQVQYAWVSSGGVVQGSDATVMLDSRKLPPGNYHVGGRLLEGKKPRQVAVCTANFSIREFDPPTVACTSDRSRVQPGQTVAIRAEGRSPQGRPLVYNFDTSGGIIQGNGDGNSGRVELSTAGVAPGTVTVRCSVADDLGHSAAAATSVVIAALPPPIVIPPPVAEIAPPVVAPRPAAAMVQPPAVAAVPPPAVAVAPRPAAAVAAPAAVKAELSATAPVAVPPVPAPKAAAVRKMCSITYPSDRKRSTTVGLEATKCLDDIARTMKLDPTARLILTGEFEGTEVNGTAVIRILAAEDYIETVRGISPGRIQMRLGDKRVRGLVMSLVPNMGEIEGTPENGLGTVFEIQTVTWPKK